MAKYDPVQRGDSLSKFPAATYNDLMDMLKWWRKQPLARKRPPEAPSQRTVVMVKNDTGEAQTAPWVVGLDEPFPLPEDNEERFNLGQYSWSGVKPDIDKHRFRFGVCLEPAAEDAVVPVVVSGEVPVSMVIVDEDFRFASMIDDSTAGLTASSSGVRIIWKPEGETGVLQGIVRLGDTGENRIWPSTATEQVTSGSSGTFTLPTNPEQDVEAENCTDNTIEIGDKTVVFERMDDDYSTAPKFYVFGFGGGGGGGVQRGTANADIGVGASGSVTITGGGSVTATNYSDYAEIHNGDKIVIWTQSGSYYCIRAGEAGLYTATLAADMAKTDATATINSAGSHLIDASNLGNTTVDNALHLCGLEDDVVILAEAPIYPNGQIIIAVENCPPRWFLGSLYAPITVDTPSVNVTLTIALDGGTVPVSDVSCLNTFKLAALSSKTVLVVRESDGTYYIVQAEHTEGDIITDLQYNATTHQFEWKYIPHSVMESGVESDWESWFEAVEVDYVQDISGDLNISYLQRTSGYMLEIGDGSNETLINFVPAFHVFDVHMQSDLTLTKQKLTTYTPLYVIGNVFPVVFGTICEEVAQETASLQLSTPSDAAYQDDAAAFAAIQQQQQEPLHDIF